MRHDGPGAPRIVAVVEPERQHRAVVPSQRAPADVARRIGPGNPCGRPRASGNPEPRAGRESPPPIVMRRPGPRTGTDPRPAIRTECDPPTVVVRTPAPRHRWIPDVA